MYEETWIQHLALNVTTRYNFDYRKNLIISYYATVFLPYMHLFSRESWCTVILLD